MRRRLGLGAAILCLLAVSLLAWRAWRLDGGDALHLSPEPGAVPPTSPADGTPPPPPPEVEAGDPPSAPTREDAGTPSPEAAPGVTAALAARPARTGPHGSLVVDIVDANGQPAPGVWIRALPWDGPDPFQHAAAARTGSDGAARLPHIRPGMAIVYSHLGPSARCVVRDGEETRVTLTLRAGRTIRGVVLGPAGDPVAAATIWLSRQGNWDGGYPVAQSDANGRFELRFVGSHHYLSARADGFGPAHLLELGVALEPEKTVELRLVGDGGGVAGRVFDPAGHPIAGAAVRVEDNANDWRIPPIELVTDDAGSFLANGVAAVPTVRVRVRVVGLAAWEEFVRVKAGAVTPVEVHLRHGGVVRGVVRDHGGRGVAGATLRIGEYADFTGSSTKSDANGEYELAAVAAGRREVVAKVESGGEARATLAIAAGAVTEWDPVLQLGRCIRGRLVDEHGAPREGWGIAADDRQPLSNVEWRASARTDADGRFLLTNCPERVLRVLIRDPDQEIYPLRVLTSVKADGAPLELIVTQAERAPCRVFGEVRDADNRPLARAQVYVWHVGEGMAKNAATDSEGRFSIGRLPAGTYRVEIRPQAGPALDLGTHELAPGQELDFEVLRREAPGYVVLHLARVDGGAVEAPIVYPMNADGALIADAQATVSYANGKARVGPLAPGRHRLWIQVPNCKPVQLDVTVGSAQDAAYDVALQARE